MNITEYNSEKPGHLWECRRKHEDKKSYEITHNERVYTQSAYIFAKYKDQPFNVLLRYDFKRSGTRADVADVRDVVQHVRVQLANMKIDRNLIWSRHVAYGSNIEEVCILTHVSEDKINKFVELAKGWRTGIEVHVVSYDRDFDYRGKSYNVLEYMMRAASNESMCKDSSILAERSDFIYGYRIWSSWNLKIDRRRTYSKHSDQNTISVN